VLTNAEVKESLGRMIDQSSLVMRSLEVVSMMIAVLGIINALLANILDRTRELGVLRAIGMLRRRVARMIVLEAGLIGLIGNIVGVALGLVLGWIIIVHVNGVHTGFYYTFTPPWLAYGVAAVWIMIAAAAAGWYPARSAARLSVTEALSYE
jgi:putative ABC transport system permease protein